MKIRDLLKKDTLTLSFEVFPPKTNTAFESVKSATESIAALKPAFMSVTYGAGGGTSAYTLDIAKNIKSQVLQISSALDISQFVPFLKSSHLCLLVSHI